MSGTAELAPVPPRSPLLNAVLRRSLPRRRVAVRERVHRAVQVVLMGDWRGFRGWLDRTYLRSYRLTWFRLVTSLALCASLVSIALGECASVAAIVSAFLAGAVLADLGRVYALQRVRDGCSPRSSTT